MALRTPQVSRGSARSRLGCRATRTSRTEVIGRLPGETSCLALALGRRFTGIDLNPAFAILAAERLSQAAGLPPNQVGRP
jgi:hypothetical protein